MKAAVANEASAVTRRIHERPVWGKEIAGFVGEKTRGIRAEAAHAMGAVNEKTGQVLDSGGTTLLRAGGLLEDAKERVSEALRAGQDAIRPAPTAGAA